MPFHPQVEAMLSRRRSAPPAPLYTLTLEEARAADLAAIRAAGGTPEPVADVVDGTLPGPAGDLPYRRYVPAGDGPFPRLLYLFGGGWTLGSIDTADGVARALTNAAGCVTVVVGYRLAPEHPFPAAVEDCYAALTWLAGEDLPVAVGGDSAGGNLAAAVTLLARERGGPRLSGQLLVYPNTDGPPTEPPADVDPLLFNERSVRWYWDHYLAGPADAAHPLAAPLRATDLTGLPPALVLTAEHDPLRDEGERYAERLRGDGVAAETVRYDGLVHGFFTLLGELDASRDAVDRAARFLRSCWPA